jgi:hypothetical protein
MNDPSVAASGPTDPIADSRRKHDRCLPVVPS